MSTEGPLDNCTAADVAALYDHLAADPIYGASFSQVVHKNRNGAYNAAAVRVYNFVRDTSEGRAMYEELKADAGGHGIATGGVVLTIRTLDAFTFSQVSSTVVSVAFAAIFLIAIYRDPVLGLLCIVPVAFSCVWVLGTMYVLSISLNALTLTVTALTIGLGIDYTIYITQRFREESRVKGAGAAIQATVENLGIPILLCAATTWAGFLVLGLSPMPLVQQFGIVAAATIAYAFILGVFVFPIFLVAYARWQEKRAQARRLAERGGRRPAGGRRKKNGWN
jgi:predicted RND superfamily exporter protein